MWGYGPSWMMGYGGGWGFMGGIFWIVILVAGIAAVVSLMRGRSRGDGYPPYEERPPSALNILEQRYAKGEIQRDEYLQKKQDLAGRAT